MKRISWRSLSRKTKGTSSRWQWGPAKNETLQQNGIISIFPLWTFLHMYQHSICTWIWSIPEFVVPIRLSLRQVFMLSRKLLNQGYLVVKMKSLLSFCLQNICVKRWPRICFNCRRHNAVLVSTFKSSYQICNKSNTTGASSFTRTAYPSSAPEFIPGF